ncbi:transmembrane protein, putative [Medicago truncatula]|uniref:Transmembrane protein, putative n=1 Tax=Medicago truncatula TaxID=3880 RepID=A0A072VHV5_MEDTR|nr:transmembrane protein, putative [Medicago truncatula]
MEGTPTIERIKGQDLDHSWPKYQRPSKAPIKKDGEALKITPLEPQRGLPKRHPRWRDLSSLYRYAKESSNLEVLHAIRSLNNIKNKDAMKNSDHGRMLVGEVSFIYFNLDAPDDINNRRIHHISVQFTSSRCHIVFFAYLFANVIFVGLLGRINNYDYYVIFTRAVDLNMIDC